jgi:acetolactate synthase-1/2/3 large subunit
MKVADYIFDYLTKKDVKKLFMISGGQAMFLDDAVCRNKKLEVICTHHEQAAAMAAEAYGRITGHLGVALVTAGPGSVNAITGLVGGYTDSSPMMIISGQSNIDCVKYQQESNIRQYGIQGINIKPFVESGTKFFVTIDDPAKTLYYISKAYTIATTGRPGPVWVDVPLDVQKMEVPESLQQEYNAEKSSYPNVNSEINEVYKLILNAKRPVFLLGQGVRISKSIDVLYKLISKLRIPILTSRLGIDIIETDNPLYIGRPGNYGERAANFAIQNADVLISVGCRLASALVGHNSKDFARNAMIIAVDIDEKELDKPGAKIDIKIQCDCKYFLDKLYECVENEKVLDFSEWIKLCNNWKNKYPVVLPEYKNESPVNSYYFSDRLSELSSKNDMILVDTGTCFHVVCQTWKIKKGQRFLTTGGLSSMGYWVAGMGACLANNRQNTIVVTGDGSLQMNIQEFATIKHNNLPIKVFIINNNGYLLIRHTQSNFMEGRLFAEGPETGVWCPDSLKIAEAYGIKGIRINSVDEVDEKIKEVLDFDGPVICDVMTPEWQLIIPRIASEKLADGTLISKPYEDMFPFLPREEFLDNMLV